MTELTTTRLSATTSPISSRAIRRKQLIGVPCAVGEWSCSSTNYGVAAFNLFVPHDLCERQFWHKSRQGFEEHSLRASVHHGPAWTHVAHQEHAPGARARVGRGGDTNPGRVCTCIGFRLHDFTMKYNSAVNSLFECKLRKLYHFA